MSTPARLAFPFLLLGLVGFADATYLSVQHYRTGPIPCFVVDGCETVTSSTYAMLGPIPLAVLGAGYYFMIVVAAIWAIEQRQIHVLRWVSALTLAGFVFSLYLVYLQAIVIRAFCFFCMISAAISTLLFIWGLIVYTQIKRRSTSSYGSS